MTDPAHQPYSSGSRVPSGDIHADWVADGIRLREMQDMLLRTVEQAERTVRVAAAMRTRALALLGAVADQEAAHAERVDDPVLASSRAVEAAHRSGVAEVAMMLRVPEGTVRRWWEDARVATEQHPRLWKALLDGEVSERHVTVALDELTTLPPAHRAPLEDAMLEKAPTVTAASLQVFARRHRELLHPESINIRHRKARAGRHLLLGPARDGMSVLTAHLPAVAANAIYNRCTDAAMAVRAPEDPRTLTQLRADAFMAYALTDGALLTPSSQSAAPTAPPRKGKSPAAGYDDTTSSDTTASTSTSTSTEAVSRSTTSPPPAAGQDGITSGRERLLEVARAETLGDDALHVASTACDVDIYGIVPTVAVLVPVDWLGDDAPNGRCADDPGEQSSAHGLDTPDGPIPRTGELVTDGPIDRATARALAARAPSLRRILTDPHTGAPLDMSRTTYRVPSHLRVFTQLRDETCRFPGCRRRAAGCDLDHVDAWEVGGSTSAANLAHLCRMHHRLKHSGAWSVSVEDNPPDEALRSAITTPDPDPHPTHDRRRGRLLPSTLRWTSPTGRTTTTRAALDPAIPQRTSTPVGDAASTSPPSGQSGTPADTATATRHETASPTTDARGEHRKQRTERGTDSGKSNGPEMHGHPEGGPDERVPF